MERCSGLVHVGDEARRHEDSNIPGMSQAFHPSRGYFWPIPGMLARPSPHFHKKPPSFLHSFFTAFRHPVGI
jgi:hypothetical protein